MWGDHIYFVSNLSGHLSLYRMKVGGSLPEPLLPPNVVLQNPHLMARYLYALFPKLGKILLMLDDNGDENYQPMLIPLDGGLPEPAFDNFFAPFRCHCLVCDPEQNRVYLTAESREDATSGAYQCNLDTGEVTHLYDSAWGAYVDASSPDHTQAVILDNYTVGDTTLTLWDHGQARLLYGAYLEDRAEGQQVPLSGIGGCHFVDGAPSLLLMTTLFEDTVGLGMLDLTGGDVQLVTITGAVHTGMGELDRLTHLTGSRYAVGYNIDGCSWLYEGTFDPASQTMRLGRVICGMGEIASGVLESHFYDKDSDRHILTYSTATSPTQIYLVSDGQVQPQTHERILGISEALLSSGEDASFTSHDGLRTSARLYLPADSLGYAPPYPLVYYVHGGPQSQERPDFAWFSMPLIQFLTLNGLAVFVPNVRGSTGYGLAYTKHVDRDWGGQDRLDHVYAMQLLADDPRVDTKRAGVVGRSYGGYMTLTLAFRHPELWKGAVDMFGPNDLLTFMDRIPETWKPYFKIAVGDPVDDHDFLVERSPRTYMQQLQAPMLVIQGQNDPRVIERESRDVVEQLRATGKTVDYLLFEDEGHDVLKYDNRVRCYNAITDFFKANL
ncbi:MAG: prolyl oligopeptidase family serine peptidase [Anaerolineae bacterium]|nr:prolyl oligopeptidase family serine peptidase [Anaerolineae bacterium]